MRTPERRYSTTHPWLTFARVDLSLAGAEFWMLLGEARSKVEHLSLALLKPTVADEMNRVYLAKGAQATTAIEGNTLSEAEVERIVAGVAHSPPPSQEYLYREVENILAAFNRIKDDVVAGRGSELTLEAIEQFDGEVLAGLEQDDVLPGVIPGIRASVVVGPYRGAPRGDCRYLVERLCSWLNGPDFEPPDDELTVPYALIKAACAHLYLAWIHPFDDGNGRTARLVELQILLSAGVPMPAAHLLSNHYNATRPAVTSFRSFATRYGDSWTGFERSWHGSGSSNTRTGGNNSSTRRSGGELRPRLNSVGSNSFSRCPSTVSRWRGGTSRP
jgi:Fic family protein